MNLKKKVFFLSLMFFFVVLTACSSFKQEEKEVKGSSNEGEKQQSEILNFAYNAQPPNLDVHSNSSVATRDIGYHVFETLLTLNDKLEVEPMLADTYDVSDDGKEITFHLREGVTFHNGKEMKAEDVVASMERWQKFSASAQTYLKGISYEIIDDYTVIAHIEKPTTLDLYTFADFTQFAAIMPKEEIENVGDALLQEYIGTGPYKLAEWKQDQYIHLTRYDGYQSRTEKADGLAGEKKAIMDEIYFNFIQDVSTRMAGLQSGEYDIANDIPQDNAEKLEENPDVKNFVQTTSFPIVLFNEREGVFTDKKLRQAANAAVNVEDILVAAYGNPDYYEANHALVKKEQTAWHTEAGKETYDLYDLEYAKKLLEESSYNGEEVIMITTRDRQDLYNMMVVVQQQLEQLGMNVKLDVKDSATFSEQKEEEYSWDLYSTAFTFRPMPIQYLFLNPEWYGWIDSEEITAINEKILSAASQEEAQQYSEELHVAFWDHLPIIKPGDQTSITSLRENITGYQSISGPVLWNVYREK